MANNHESSLGDRLKRGVAIGTLGVLGITGIAACSSNASAEKAPTTTSAKQTVEASPTVTASPTETAPVVHETDITQSALFNRMLPADQAIVEKDMKLSFDDFLKRDWTERSKVASVIFDANAKASLDKLRKDPTYGNAVDADYQVGANPLVDSVKDNPMGPVVNIWFKQAAAFNMAATGDSGQLEDAMKIVAGTVRNASESDNSTALTPGYADMIQQLKDVSAAKQDTVNHFPGLAGPTLNMSHVHPDGYAIEVEMTPGGSLVQYYMANTSYKLKDGTEQGDWSVSLIQKPGDASFSTDLKNYLS